MSVFTIRRKDTDFKIGDIIKVSMSIEPQIPEEDKEKLEINLDDYDTKYEISYSFPRDLGLSEIDFTIDAGYSGLFDDNIKTYLETYIGEEVNEIEDYEIFDVDTSSFEYQTAKIRVKSLKEEEK